MLNTLVRPAVPDMPNLNLIQLVGFTQNKELGPSFPLWEASPSSYPTTFALKIPLSRSSVGQDRLLGVARGFGLVLAESKRDSGILSGLSPW